MEDRDKKILKNIIEYFQDKLDNGCHKIIYNDLMWDEKTVDIINLLNDILENYISKDKIKKIFNKQIEEYEKEKEYRYTGDVNDEIEVLEEMLKKLESEK